MEQAFIILDKIRTTVGENTPLIICPGNHDMNLSACDEIYKPIFNAISTPDKANNFVAKLTDPSKLSLLPHIEGYLSLAKKINPESYKSHPLFYTQSLKIGGIMVGIASFNSTWLTAGGGEQDYGRLYIGERQIDLAVQEIKDCDIKIALMHHSLDWLPLSEKSIIHRALVANFNAFFSGHNHDNSASVFVGNTGSLFTSNTGCIYQSRNYFNGYSIINLDIENQCWIVEAREYYSQRDIFDISIRFASDGIQKYPLLSSQVINDNLIIPPSVMNIAQEHADSKLLSYTISEVAPKQVNTIFVEPPLASVSEKKLIVNKDGLKKPRRKAKEDINLNMLISSNEDIMVIGKRESGKSTLLHQIAVNRFMEFHANARIGFVIDLGTIAKYDNNALLQQALNFIGGELRRKDLINLLKKGYAVVGFDNVHLHSQEHISLIEAFCMEYPEVRYVFTASEELQDEFSISAPPQFNRKVKVIYIHSFTSRHTKELVKKWFGDHKEVCEKHLLSVNKLLARLNIPRTPFLISVLLWVMEQKSQSNLINQATVIEVLIDGLLNKFEESKARSEFDSTIQSHFLSEFAVKLDDDKTEWLSSIFFDEYVVGYFQRKGLHVSTRGFVEELLKKGLLYESNDCISFKFDCFRSYFLAKKFSEQGDVLKRVMSVDSIGKYIPELDILTGLHRDRITILEQVRAICKELLLSSNMDMDFSYMDNIGNDTTYLTNEAVLDSIEEKVINEPLSYEERENFINESEVPSQVSLDHNEGRKRRDINQSSAQKQFLSSLQAFSIVLRNSELIDDVELKKICLHEILTLWAKAMLSMIHTLSNVDLDELLQQEPGHPDKTSKDKFIGFIRLFVPQIIVAVMNESLFTPKLEKFIMENTKDGELVVRSFAVLLALESVDKDSINAVKSLIPDMKKNKFIAQAVFLKLLFLYHYEATSGSIPLLRECLAEVFLILRGGNNQKNMRVKGEFLKDLDEARQKNIQ